MKQLRIFAFGGNEVSPTGERDPKTGKAVVADIAMQWRRTAETCRFIAGIVERHQGDLFILTHGNGPQVGNILLRSEYSRPILHGVPLDVCGADTQGAMAYILAQLNNELSVRGIAKKVCGIVTQIEVDSEDPDFKTPSKYIGPAYSKEEAVARRDNDGWQVKLYKKDSAGSEVWRRVVASPVPKKVLEIEAVEAALKAGLIPIAAGGGGIPVVRVKPDSAGAYGCNYGVSFRGPASAEVYTGVEAVIDKDLASALLGASLLSRAKARGEKLEASLTIFTGEDGAKLNYQTPQQVDLRKLTVGQADELLSRNPCPFPAGSMGPKIKAAVAFVKAGGTSACITKTELFEAALKGEAGTTITA